jgi:hypothetical protein
MGRAPGTSLGGLGRVENLAPAPAVQLPSWAKALRGARDGAQPRPRWPACEATAYRHSRAPAPSATRLGRYGAGKRSPQAPRAAWVASISSSRVSMWRGKSVRTASSGEPDQTEAGIRMPVTP